MQSQFAGATSGTHRVVADLLRQASITIDGAKPWDIQLKRPGVPERALAQGNWDWAKRTSTETGRPGNWTSSSPAFSGPG